MEQPGHSSGQIELEPPHFPNELTPENKGTLLIVTDASCMPNSASNFDAFKEECYSSRITQHISGSNPPMSKSPIMADVANSLNASTPTCVDSGQIISPESPDSVLLSPGVKEAMDRIFPCSASQLLTHRLTFEEDPLMGSVAKESGNVKLPLPLTSTPKSIINPTSSLSYVFSTVNTTIKTASAPTALLTSVATNVSPIISSAVVDLTNSSPVTPAEKISEKDRQPENGSAKIPHESRMKLAKLRISEPDLGVISVCGVSHEKESQESVSKRNSSVDISSSEVHFLAESDPEDMRRPFANVAKEKKKHKKKRKRESNSANSLALENINSEDDFKTSSQPKEGKNASGPVNECNMGISVSLKRVFSKGEKDNKSLNVKLSSEADGNGIYKTTTGLDLNSQDSFSQSSIVENGSVSQDTFYMDGEVTEEDFSNLSFSSLKENVKRKKKSHQKLPRTKRQSFNISKDKTGINRYFLPCFVVVKKLDLLSINNVSKDSVVINNILPLTVRVKYLSHMCAGGEIYCEGRKKDTGVRETMYKNIFEETVLPGNSDDEFERSRGGRSLRKRDKNISYVEPSEDDILDEFSRKRSRSKHKEKDADKEKDSSKDTDVLKEKDIRKDIASKSEDEGPSDSKKKKKHEASELVRTVHSADSKGKVSFVRKTKQQNSSNKNNATTVEANTSIPVSVPSRTNNKGLTEIVVYPRYNPNEPSSYHVRMEGGKMVNMSLPSEKTKTSTQELPPVTRISVLPASTLSGSLPHPSLPGSMFPPLSLNFPGGLHPPPLVTGISGAPLATPISTVGGATKPPQYCMVKMDGKDVLLQLVPSGGLGVPVSLPGMQTMILPGNKRFVVPLPSTVPLVSNAPQLLGHPLQPPLAVPISTPGVPLPMSAVATAGQGNTVSSLSLQSIFGIPIMSRPPQTAHPSTSTFSLSTLPVIPASQLANLTSSACVRPLTLSSSGPIPSLSSVAVATPPPTILTSAASPAVVSPTIRPITPSKTSLSSTLAPMAAPNTTTVVRSVRVPSSNLRTIVPNQSTGVCSVRIFVPGCSATGTPGRFATLGSVATSSPLTRLSASSELLPQRKQNTDQALTPEQRAAKRRKLEKKYPLPPGVVIKTEPLDSPPSMSTAAGGGRSLLGQNLQLISSTSRPGTSIRIISPSWANALTGRNVRGNSNVIYRAASIGGRQTILVPTSLGLITTTRAALTTTATVTVASLSSTSTATSLTSASSIVPVTAVSPVTQASLTELPTTAEVTASSINLSPSVASTRISVLTTSVATNALQDATAVIESADSSALVAPFPADNSTTALAVTASVTNIPIPCTIIAPTSVSTSVTKSLSSRRISDGNSPPPTLIPISELDSINNSYNAKDTPTSRRTINSPAPDLSPIMTVACPERISTVIASINTSPSQVDSSLTTLSLRPSSKTVMSPDLNPCPTEVSVEAVPHTAPIEHLKRVLEDFRKFVQAQETLGLKGDRLEKLKDLLRKKEQQLIDEQTLLDSSTSSVSSEASKNDAEEDKQQAAAAETDELGGTETDPFVIDD